MDKENATTAVDGSMGATRKKSRSKSMGPGGLDPLKKANGNRRAVCFPPRRPIGVVVFGVGSWVADFCLVPCRTNSTVHLEADNAPSGNSIL